MKQIEEKLGEYFDKPEWRIFINASGAYAANAHQTVYTLFVINNANTSILMSMEVFSRRRVAGKLCPPELHSNGTAN